MKHRIWDDLICYAMTAWEKIKKLMKTNRFSALAIVQGCDKTLGARGGLCKRHGLNIEWNWKRQRI